MLLSQFSEARVGDYTEKLNWLISSMMKGTPLIIPYMLLKLILEPVLFILKNPSWPPRPKKPIFQITEEEGPQIWDMSFDGAFSKEVVRAGIVLVSPTQEYIHLSFKLTFQVTNNIEKYEALILGLSAAKEMGIKGLKVFGDVDLIIQ